MVETTSSVQRRTGVALVWLALLVSLGAAVGQGFGRFGYALLLPPMRADLGWSYAQAGLINSANAAGYLAGALSVGFVVARWGPATVVRASLLLASASLIATGLTDQFWALLAARALTGYGAGTMFIGGMAVVVALDSSHRSDLPVAVYYAGPGIGIVISGLLVPWMLGPLGWDWRTVWIALGGLGLLAMLLVELPLRLVRRIPRRATTQRAALFVASDYLRIWPALTAYGLFGLGYIGYMTFIVAFLRAGGASSLAIQGFWVLLGFCAALCGFTWRPVIRRMPSRFALCVILLAMAIGAFLPVISASTLSLALSAVLFGSSFLAVVTVITQEVRETLPPERWTAVMGNATALFALGQLIGPTLTGVIADSPGGLAHGLAGSALLLGIAAMIALIRPRRKF